jgi:hypothetical protein
MCSGMQLRVPRASHGWELIDLFDAGFDGTRANANGHLYIAIARRRYRTRVCTMKQYLGCMIPKLGGGDKTMSLSEDVRPLLAARAATDPNAARLLEIFTKAHEILSERSREGIGDLEMPRAQVPRRLVS